MIKRVRFDSFKSLREVTLDLGPLTVLVGPNGCGKSSILRGMDLLSRCCRPVPGEETTPGGRFALVFEGQMSPRRLVTRDLTAIALRAEDSRDEITLSIAAGPKDLQREDGGFRLSVNRDGQFDVAVSADTKAGELSKKLERVETFGDAVYLHLDATLLTATSVADEEEPIMAPDGGGLASSLAWIAGAAPDTLAEIARDLSSVVPGVRAIRTFRERVTDRAMEAMVVDGQAIMRPRERTRIGDRFAVDFAGMTGSVPADLLSEGTVLALGLLTKLREPRRPRVVLLDDIDRGLHIEAQSKLVHVLRNLMKLDPELQIVCTTHSPYLLDRFEPSEVRVLALDDQRHTHARKLTDHPDFDKWQFGTQTGELWAALGEAWVTGARGEAQ
jgi:predicted ATPase